MYKQNCTHVHSYFTQITSYIYTYTIAEAVGMLHTAWDVAQPHSVFTATTGTLVLQAVQDVDTQCTHTHTIP